MIPGEPYSAQTASQPSMWSAYGSPRYSAPTCPVTQSHRPRGLDGILKPNPDSVSPGPRQDFRQNNCIQRPNQMFRGAVMSPGVRPIVARNPVRPPFDQRPSASNRFSAVTRPPPPTYTRTNVQILDNAGNVTTNRNGIWPSTVAAGSSARPAHPPVNHLRPSAGRSNIAVPSGALVMSPIPQPARLNCPRFNAQNFSVRNPGSCGRTAITPNTTVQDKTSELGYKRPVGTMRSDQTEASTRCAQGASVRATTAACDNSNRFARRQSTHVTATGADAATDKAGAAPDASSTKTDIADLWQDGKSP